MTVTESGGLELRIEGAEGEVVVYASGELDMATAPQLEKALVAAIESEVGTVRCDLGEVTFMDSSGLAALLRADAGAGGAGIRFVISRPQATVVRLLELTSTDVILATVDTDVTPLAD